MANIGYCDFENVSEPIVRYLEQPLSNLHWKAHNEPLRSINQLKVNIVRQATTSHHSQATGNIVKQNDQFFHNLILQSDNNRIPYIFLFFVPVTSIDDYRSKTRPAIKSWLNNSILNTAIETEWLIVFVETESKTFSPSSRNSLLVKAKNDFSDEGENRCTILENTDPQSPTFVQSMGILSTLLKEKVLISFTKRLNLYRSQLALLEERPLINPHFKLILMNYIMKVYRDMTLHEESLEECDKLMVTFESMRKQGSISFPSSIEKLELASFGDNPLFDSNIDFDKLILESKMNIFQFQCHMFLNISNCLLALAESDSSLTFSSMHIVDLLRRAKIFVTTTIDGPASRSYPGLYQFQFLIADEFLSNNLVLRNLELNLKNPDIGKLADVMEAIGELKLTQRDQLVKLGECLNYNIAGLNSEISLNDELQADTFDLFYAPLKSSLASQENFENEFNSMTEAVIDGFNVAGIRPRTIDTLSTEIAIIAYHKGDYAKAKVILGHSCKYFQEEGWDSIGSYLLRLFIECLEKTNDDSDNLLLTSYINLLSTKTCGEAETEKAAQKIVELSLKQKLTVSLPRLFDLDIDNEWKSSGPNRHFVSAVLKSEFAFHFDEIILYAQDNEETIMEFRVNDAFIQKGVNELDLKTNDVIYDTFQFTKLTAKAANLTFEHDLEHAELFITPILENNNLSASLSVPADRVLNKNEMALTVKAGSIEVENLFIQFSCGTDGVDLEVLESEATCQDGQGKFLKMKPYKADNLTLSFGVEAKLNEYACVKMKFPYLLKYTDQEPTTLKMKYHLKYFQEGEAHSYIAKEDISPSLTVAVTVQDIFKSSVLYTNFSIGSSDGNNPVRIIDVDFSEFSDSESSYEIETPGKLARSVVAFGGQPVKLFYEVKRIGKGDQGKFLALRIKYRDLRDECLFVVKQMFAEFVSKSSSPLNFHTLSAKFAKSLSFRLGFYSLTNYIKVENIDLSTLTSTKAEAEELTVFFESFIKGNGYYLENADFAPIDRSLLINVPMPVIPVIHEVELKFKKQPNYVVGEPLHVELLLRSSTSWSGKPPITFDDEEEPAGPAFLGPPTPLASRPTSPGLEPISSFANGDGQYWKKGSASSTSTIDLNLESSKNKKKKKAVSFQSKKQNASTFQVELQTFDNWLLSGVKKFSFDMTPNGSHQFERNPIDLVLIPLKVGLIPLPKIEIKEVEDGEVINDVSGIEIDYKNNSECLVIVSDLDKISFDL